MAKPASPARLLGAGSLSATAAQLLNWSVALHTGRVLTDSSYRKLTADYGNRYGYGVRVFKRFDRPVIGHDGRVPGFASDLASHVNDSLSVVVLSNVRSVARDEIRRLVAAEVLGLQTPPGLALSIDESAGEPDAHVAGTYLFGPGFSVAVRTSGGRVLVRANEGSESELIPLKSGEWFSRMLYAVVRFERDATGRFDQLVWGRNANAPVGRKQPAP